MPFDSVIEIMNGFDTLENMLAKIDYLEQKSPSQKNIGFLKRHILQGNRESEKEREEMPTLESSSSLEN
jgi:hypothetical protein